MDIIYKIWEMIMTEKRSVIMNIIATELQTAYKVEDRHWAYYQ